MVFSYYHRLTPRQQLIYLQSDSVPAVRLYRPRELRPLVERLAQALEGGERRAIQSASYRLTLALTQRLQVPPVRVRVLTVRPHDEAVEVHGLYLAAVGRKWAVITVWMRTAQRRHVVAFRTFLRTLLHELSHHLDYRLLGLGDSFHTEGFYRRESSLFNQLVPKRVAHRSLAKARTRRR